MECNKEDAVRAKELAEKKMQDGDFMGAKRMLQKAQQLYPGIENISQLSMVCEVHCSALNKLNGLEMDWYGILQVERFSDEAAIRKQYRKLALALHPDKNRYAGAEAAFKLIGEAHRLLTDPAKRAIYDNKCRSSVRPPAHKPAPHQSNKNSHAKKKHATVDNFPNAPYPQQTSSHPHQQPQKQTFWTCCRSCGTRFQYFRDFLNKMLRCQNCHQTFVATDLGIHSMPSTWNQFFNPKGVPNHGPFKVAPQSNGGKPSGVSIPDKTAGVDPKANVGKASDAGGSYKPEEVKAGRAAEVAGGFKPQEKANGSVNVKSGEGVPMPKDNTTKPKGLGPSKNASRKRGRKSVDESNNSFDTGSTSDSDEDVVFQDNANVSAQNSQPRRSSRQKHHVSYNENLSDDDFMSPQKRSKGEGLSNTTDQEIKDVGADGVGSKDDGLAAAAAASCTVDGKNKEFKQKASSILEESLLNKKSKTRKFMAKGEEASISDNADAKLENDNEKSKVGNVCKSDSGVACADADFSDFEKLKAEGCFEVKQVWAIYDPIDCMPRFYARIKKVFSPSFKLQITWLEASPDDKSKENWCDKGLPVACGKYEIGGTQVTADRLMFSHQITLTRGSDRGSYLVYPSKGETWALFKDWDINWSLEAEKHRPPYQFEFVEVISAFDKDTGIQVAFLNKVDGFVSIFQQAPRNGELLFHISPGELYRFSHQIPSVKMTGSEGKGVPAGSFELDPASLPSNLVNFGDLGRMEMDKEHLDAKATGLCAESSKDQSKPVKGPEKQEKNEAVAEALQPRRSPRDLSKRGAHARQFTILEDIKDENDVLASASPSQSGDKMHFQGKSRSTNSYTKSPKSSGRRIAEVERYNFNSEKSEDKFQPDQIWVLYSDKDGVPRNYAQVKSVESAPNFRVHVLMLEPCSWPKDKVQAACCGMFKAQNGKPRVLSPTSFSHRLKAVSFRKNQYEIYPRKGEIWALYKNWNSESSLDQGSGECDIVEVLEENNEGVKVAVLIPILGIESFYRAPRSQRSKIGIMDIPRTQFARFSHQCCAFLYTGENDSLRGCWELHPTSIPSCVTMLN